MKKQTTHLSILATALLLGACASTDHHAHHDSVALQNCAIQQTIPGAKATGAFLTMNKRGNTPLALVSAAAPAITDHVEIHEMAMNNGTMTMQEINEYPLAEGDNVFKKGGYHVMLMGLDKTLTVGETYPLTLNFSDNSSQTCQAVVKSVEALTPKGMKGMKGMKKPHSHGGGKVHTH